MAAKLEKAKKSSPRGETGSEDGARPEGGKKARLKKRPEKAKAPAKVSAASLGADGAATVDGVTGWYSCDGGCDKATIVSTFAKVLEENGTELIKYPVPEAFACDVD